MHKIKAFLVDDEAGALRALQAIIEEDAPEIEVVGTARNVDDAHVLIGKWKPDLLFLDIQLQHRTGFDLLNKGFDFDFEVIFVTAYDQYAIQAFENNALSYLLKPISFDAFQKAKQRALKVIRSGARDETSASKIRNLFKNRVAIPHASSIEYLVPEEIVYARADGSYCEIYLHDGRVRTISKPLKYIADRIESDAFFRAHRSYLVNAAFIRKWNKADGGAIILTDETVIPLSREGRKLLFELG